MRAERGEENAKGRDRKKRPAQDRILWRSIKSWQVQSFLRDDPGNGRAVALLIPLPAANFSPALLFFVSWSSPDTVSLSSFSLPSRGGVLYIVLHASCSLCRIFSLSYLRSCIMPYATVILFPYLIARILLFVCFNTRKTQNIFIFPRTTHVIHANEIEMLFLITVLKSGFNTYLRRLQFF